MSTFSPCTVHWCCKQCPMKSIKCCFWKAMICAGEFWTDQLWTLFLMEQAGFLLTIVLNAKKSVCTKCPDTLLSDCNRYGSYLIRYSHYLCKCIYNVNKSPVDPNWQPLSPSTAFVLGSPVFHEHQLFLRLHKIWNEVAESIWTAFFIIR